MMFASRERPPASEHRRRAIVGTPDTVREGLEAVAAEYGADEVMVLTITHEHEARRRSYELIAEAFGGGVQASRSAGLPVTSGD